VTYKDERDLAILGHC